MQIIAQNLDSCRADIPEHSILVKNGYHVMAVAQDTVYQAYFCFLHFIGVISILPVENLTEGNLLPAFGHAQSRTVIGWQVYKLPYIGGFPLQGLQELIPVHTFGQLTSIKEIMKLTLQVWVIEKLLPGNGKLFKTVPKTFIEVDDFFSAENKQRVIDFIKELSYINALKKICLHYNDFFDM